MERKKVLDKKKIKDSDPIYRIFAFIIVIATWMIIGSCCRFWKELWMVIQNNPFFVIMSFCLMLLIVWRFKTEDKMKQRG